MTVFYVRHIGLIHVYYYEAIHNNDRVLRPPHWFDTRLWTIVTYGHVFQNRIQIELTTNALVAESNCRPSIIPSRHISL